MVLMSSIYSEQQLSTIILWLEKWDLPVKYAYMTETWSAAWSAIEETRIASWQSFSDAILLHDTIELYLQELWVTWELTIFDFWCWTWETIKKTLKKLTNQWMIINYHAFDISEKIIALCKKNLYEVDWVHFDYDIIDFEISNLVNIIHDVRSKYKNTPVLWLLLWNTIWNFSSIERVLSNITEALRLQDKLVVWIERANIQNQKWYDTMIKNYNSDIVKTLVLSTLSELWISIDSWITYWIFDTSKKLIEMYWKLEENLSLSIASTSIEFQKWERIRIAISQKIDEIKLSQIITDLDLRIANIRTNSANSYLQVLISSKRK